MNFAVPRRGCECNLCRKTRGLEPLPDGELRRRREARAARKKGVRIVEQQREDLPTLFHKVGGRA